MNRRSRKRLAGGLATVLLLSGCGWFDSTPSIELEIVTNVVWESSQPSGPLDDDPLVQFVRDHLLREAASLNAFNFSLMYRLEADMYRSVRGSLSDPLPGHERMIGPVMLSGPWVIEPLVVERETRRDSSGHVDHAVYACVTHPKMWSLIDGEIVVFPQQAGGLFRFGIVEWRGTPTGGPRTSTSSLFVRDRDEWLLEDFCTFSDPPIARFDPQPDPSLLPYITPKMVVGPSDWSFRDYHLYWARMVNDLPDGS